MTELTSLTINKNSKGFTPKVKKRQPKKSLLSIHDSILNNKDDLTEEKPKMSTFFIKKSTAPQLISSTTTTDSATINVSNKNNVIPSVKRQRENDESIISLTSEQKYNNSDLITMGFRDTSKKKGKSISIPTINNIPTDNNMERKKDGKLNEQQINDKVDLNQITKPTSKNNSTNTIENNNNDRTTVSTSELLNPLQNNNNDDHSDPSFINVTIPSSSTPNHQQSLNNGNNNKDSQNMNNKAPNTEYSFIAYNGISMSESSVPAQKKRLLQYIADIPYTASSKNVNRQSQDNINTNGNTKGHFDENNYNLNKITDYNNDINSIDGDKHEEGNILQQEQPILQECSNAPQLRIVNGEIVLDASSLYIESNNMSTSNATTERPDYEYIEEDERSRILNSQTHRGSKTKAKRWTREETDLFYQGLRRHGTDFETIAKMIPSRNRLEIKNMFNRQEKINPWKITDAVLCKNSSN
ncbi:hypothetical protein BJ944DRAFT_269932 [Cunninghamella echinulata]|nr:hypothetical protein BJ944DRAFT_269932 [Cunninghamella echinulata]